MTQQAAATETSDEDFAELLQRVRSGDAEAAQWLVREYEPEVRREVRLRLTDRSLRRYLDSMDICQSVLGNFFVRAALGQFDITSPAQLVRLLITMARNKVIDRHRHESLARKEGNCELLEDSELARGEPSPSAIVSQKDLLHEVRNRLTAEERSLAEQRGRGETWDNIGASLGTSPEALRKRLERAFDRVAAELRLDE